MPVSEGPPDRTANRSVSATARKGCSSQGQWVQQLETPACKRGLGVVLSWGKQGNLEENRKAYSLVTMEGSIGLDASNWENCDVRWKV